MDILIKGERIELPKTGECYIDIRIYETGEIVIDGDQDKTAKAIELPEHGDLKDADVLIEQAPVGEGYLRYLSLIRNSPTLVKSSRELSRVKDYKIVAFKVIEKSTGMSGIVFASDSAIAGCMAYKFRAKLGYQGNYIKYDEFFVNRSVERAEEYDKYFDGDTFYLDKKVEANNGTDS